MDPSSIKIYDQIMDMLHEGADSRAIDDFLKTKNLSTPQMGILLKQIDPQIIKFETYRTEKDKALQLYIMSGFLAVVFIGINLATLRYSGGLFIWSFFMIPAIVKLYSQAKKIRTAAEKLLIDKNTFG